MLENLSFFECYRCGMCCKNLLQNSIMIFPSDAKRISEAIRVTKEQFLTQYCEFKEVTYSTGCLNVYYLKINKTRQCMFLENDLCSIYKYRPVQCKRTPYDFFSYKSLWEYMPCVNKEKYLEGKSYSKDMELIHELFTGY